MKMRSIIPVALSLVLGIGSVAMADPYSNAVQNDLYNGNTPNQIPTPYFTPTGPESGFDLFNAVNQLSGNTLTLTRNEQLDPYYAPMHHVFQFEQSTATIMVLGYGANNKNTIGVSSMTGAPIQSLLTVPQYSYGFSGNGSIASPFLGVDFSLAPDTNFTFYIDSFDWKTNFTTSSMYYSQPVLNPDQYDHMIGYHVGEIAELVGMTVYISDGTQTVAHVLTENAILLGFKDRNYADYTGPLGWPYEGTLGDDNYANLMFLIDTPSIEPIPDPGPVPEPATMTLMSAGLVAAWLLRRRSKR